MLSKQFMWYLRDVFPNEYMLFCIKDKIQKSVIEFIEVIVIELVHFPASPIFNKPSEI